jgi:hypothetical protein
MILISLSIRHAIKIQNKSKPHPCTTWGRSFLLQNTVYVFANHLLFRFPLRTTLLSLLIDRSAFQKPRRTHIHEYATPHKYLRENYCTDRASWYEQLPSRSGHMIEQFQGNAQISTPFIT